MPRCTLHEQILKKRVIHLFHKFILDAFYVPGTIYNVHTKQINVVIFFFPFSFSLASPPGVVGGFLDPQQALLGDLWPDEAGPDQDSPRQPGEGHCP